MRRLSTALLVTAIVAGGIAGTSEAATRALAADGGVYVVTAGAYGQLFPSGSAAEADAPVLALTVIRPDGSSDSFVVPGTEGAGTESSPSLFAEPGDDALHLLWEGGDDGSVLHLATYAADEWSEPVNVSRGYPVRPGSARVAVTRDSAELQGPDGEPVSVYRSLLHVVWASPTADNGEKVVYAPVAIENGAYVGDHALYELASFVPAPAPAGEPGAPTTAGGPPVASASPHVEPTVQPGADGRAAVAAFVDPATGRLVTLELRMVSAELSHMGDALRQRLLEIGSSLPPGAPGSLGRLAAGARAQLINVGHHLDPAARQFLAAQVEAYVLANGGDWAYQLETMAERTRGRFLELSAAFDGASLAHMEGGARPQLINVGHHLEHAGLTHDLRLRVAAEHAAPETGSAPGTVFLSGSGEQALVAWVDEGVVYFRESEGAGWGPQRSLGIGLGDDPEVVRELLEGRVRNH